MPSVHRNTPDSSSLIYGESREAPKTRGIADSRIKTTTGNRAEQASSDKITNDTAPGDTDLSIRYDPVKFWRKLTNFVF